SPLRSSGSHLRISLTISVNRNHRDLPSFPTRRSSDLRTSAGHRDSSAAGADRAAGDTGDRGRGAGRDDRADHTGDVAGGPPAAADRKSTRLNSSHVKISYAVFCLKKKKQ